MARRGSRRRRSRRTRRTNGTVTFYTRSGRHVVIHQRAKSRRGTRRRRGWPQTTMAAAYHSCRRKGKKPFTKGFGSCVKSYFRAHKPKSARRRRRR